MPVYTLIFSKFYNRPSFLETLLCLIYSFFAIKRGTQCNALISFIAENIFFLLRQRIPAIYAPPSTQRIIIGLTATASKALLAIKQMTPTIDNSIANVKNSFQSISFQRLCTHFCKNGRQYNCYKNCCNCRSNKAKNMIE